MAIIEKWVDVNCPVHAAYNFWEELESFPKFMEGVREIRKTDNQRVHWRAEVAGVEREWDAEITEQVPDQRVAWQSINGPKNNGGVTFHPLSENRARVIWRVEYDPEGFIQNVSDFFGVVERRIEADLKRFKDLVESQPQNVWRSEGSTLDRSTTEQQPNARPVSALERAPSATSNEQPMRSMNMNESEDRKKRKAKSWRPTR